MPLGAAASGLTEGLTQGLRLLSTFDQRRKREADERAAGLNLYMRAVETVTKHPETLPHIRAALQPYGMDLDPSITSNLDETRKAHGSFGQFLASGDFEAFSADMKRNPQWGNVFAKNATALGLIKTAHEKADIAYAIKRVNQSARERGGVKPGDPEWNNFLRREELETEDPRVAAYLKEAGHLRGPEATTYQAQDPEAVARLAAAREYGGIWGREAARSKPYEEFLTGGVPRDITGFAPRGPVTAAPAREGPLELRWGPDDLTLRSGPAMQILGGQMDPVPPAPRAAVAPPPRGQAPVQGGPTRLAPEQEAQFQDWYAGWAQRAGINPNPDDPQHRYDYRAAFLAGAQPQVDPADDRYHWPSQFKAPDHPNRYVGGIDTITGQPQGRRAPARRTVGDVEQERARELARERGAGGAEGRREGGAPDAGTWSLVQTADGQTMLMNSRTGELRQPSMPLKPKTADAGTWVKERTAEGRVVLRNTKTNELREPDEPLAAPPTPEPKPKKYADMMTVLGSARESAGIPPGPGEAKDAEKAAAARARLILQFERDLNASRGDAAIAANSVMKRDGWDPATVRAAQGKTSKYLAQQPGGAPSPSRTIPATAPDQGTQDARRALRPPTPITRDAAKAELRRLLEAGHSKQSAAAAMRSVGWPIQ